MVHRSETELTLDNILFKDRNKNYGAYHIRSIYNSYLKRATLIAVSIFTIAFLSPKVVKMFQGEPPPEEEIQITEVILTEPPPIDPKTTPPPPPPNVLPAVQPPKIASVEFLPPKVVEDEKVIEEKEPPTQESMKNVNPGDKTVDVEPDPNANLNEVIVSGNEGNAEVGDVEAPAVFVGEPAVFQGDYLKFLRKNLRYSDEAANKKIQGKVFLKFVIEKDGSITDIKVVKGLGYGLDDEAIRVVKLMDKKWSVGKNNGVEVRSWKSLAIEFKYVEK